MTATAERPYTRPISPVERGYLNAAATGTPQLIQMVIEGAGHINPQALRNAVRASAAASPGVTVRRRGAAWHAGGPVPPVIELPPDADDSHPFYHRDLSVVSGPVCEIGLQHLPAPRLIVRASHIVTDGRGLRHWIADIFRVLRGEEPAGAPSTADATHIRDAAGAVSPAESPPRAQPLPPLLGHGRTDGTPLWIRRTVQAAPQAVAARVAAALSNSLTTDTSRLIIPVDLRRHAPSVRSTANLTSQLVLDCYRQDSWERLHGEILGALLRKRDLAVLDRDFRRHNPFANSLSEARGLDGTRFPCTAIITDHGQIDPDTFRTPQFRPMAFYTLPMLVPYAEMFLSTCRMGGSTEVTLSCRDRPGAREAVGAVMDGIEQALNAGA